MKMEDNNPKPRREDVCPSKKGTLDLDAARDRLAETQGPEYWRSLEELAGSPDFQEMLHREFPKGASEWLDSVSRRGFLKLMGASLAMAGMTACTKQPLEPIVPYVKQPEEVVPGRPLFFATAFTLGGYASPLLVESHLYRPTKIEGNDKHPASLGGTDIFSQASILGMYDPDRSQTVTYLGDIRSWGSLVEAMRAPLNIQKVLQGAGIRILTPTISSPTLADQLQSFLKAYPQAKWHVYEPVNRDNVLEGAKLAFGQPVETRYDFSKADVILSLDADFLYAGFPGFTRYARDFAKRRNPDAGEMSRLYVAESTPSSTGAKADHRLPLRAVEIESFVRALDMMLGDDTDRSMVRAEQQKFLDSVLARTSRAHRGSSVVLAGDHQSRGVHAFVHRDQSDPRQCRQDGFLHRSGKRQPGESNRVPQRPGRRHARRQGGHPDHPGRKSCLRCARRSWIRRRAQEHEHSAARASRSLPERDRGTLPVARERGALSRSLGRRPRL